MTDVDRIVQAVLAWNTDSPRGHYQEWAWLLVARIRELEADLADARLIAREQEDAHVAAKLRWSECSTEGVQCMRCGSVYNGQGDINFCPSCRPPPVDNAHVAEGCEPFAGSPSRDPNLSTGSGLSDAPKDRGGEA